MAGAPLAGRYDTAGNSQPDPYNYEVATPQGKAATYDTAGNNQPPSTYDTAMQQNQAPATYVGRRTRAGARPRHDLCVCACAEAPSCLLPAACPS